MKDTFWFWEVINERREAEQRKARREKARKTSSKTQSGRKYETGKATREELKVEIESVFLVAGHRARIDRGRHIVARERKREEQHQKKSSNKFLGWGFASGEKIINCSHLARATAFSLVLQSLELSQRVFINNFCIFLCCVGRCIISLLRFSSLFSIAPCALNSKCSRYAELMLRPRNEPHRCHTAAGERRSVCACVEGNRERASERPGRRKIVIFFLAISSRRNVKCLLWPNMVRSHSSFMSSSSFSLLLLLPARCFCWHEQAHIPGEIRGEKRVEIETL